MMTGEINDFRVSVMKSTLRGRLRSSEENHCSYMKESAEVVQHLIWILVDSD